MTIPLNPRHCPDKDCRLFTYSLPTIGIHSSSAHGFQRGGTVGMTDFWAVSGMISWKKCCDDLTKSHNNLVKNR